MTLGCDCCAATAAYTRYDRYFEKGNCVGMNTIKKIIRNRIICNGNNIR